MSGKAQNEHIASGVPAAADMTRTCGNDRKVPIGDIASPIAVSALSHRGNVGRKEIVMYALAPTSRSCPNCKSDMTVVMITPLLFFDGLDEVTYGCTQCSVEVTRTFSHASVFGPLSGVPAPQSPRG
jgi:hypothetical protein